MFILSHWIAGRYKNGLIIWNIVLASWVNFINCELSSWLKSGYIVVKICFDFLTISHKTEKRKIEKYDHKAHKKWMAKWSGVSDIMCKKGWLLLKYRWGYDQRFCYELVNVRTPDKRLYIGETSKDIYTFDVNGNKMSFDFSEQTDEQIQWKKATVSI